MSALPTSGTGRRRGKAVRNRHHVEDMAFYRDGTIPASSTQFSICSCGAKAFARDGFDLDSFFDAHAYCDDALRWDDES